MPLFGVLTLTGFGKKSGWTFSMSLKICLGVPHRLHFFRGLVPSVLVRHQRGEGDVFQYPSGLDRHRLHSRLDVYRCGFHQLGGAAQVLLRLFHQVAVLPDVEQFGLFDFPATLRAGYAPSPLFQFLSLDFQHIAVAFGACRVFLRVDSLDRGLTGPVDALRWVSEFRGFSAVQALLGICSKHQVVLDLLSMTVPVARERLRRNLLCNEPYRLSARFQSDALGDGHHRLEGEPEPVPVGPMFLGGTEAGYHVTDPGCSLHAVG